MPPGACDCHAHVFGPADRFGFISDRSYTPPERLAADYGAMLASLGVTRGVIVQPSVYGTDNGATLSAIAELGTNFRGVAVLPPDADDTTLADHAAGGIRGLRLSGVAPGGVGLDHLEAIGARLRVSGWHIQLLANFASERDLAARIRRLDVPVVIDHFGLVDAAEGPNGAAFREVVALAGDGVCWVKLSAPYLVSRERGWPDVTPLAHALLMAAPDRLVWGTDWPHPAASTPPDDAILRGLLETWVPDAALRRRILVDNPAALYGFPA